MTKNVIFDFDGVLADSFETLYAINKIAARKIGVSISAKEYRKLFFGKLHTQIKLFLNVDEVKFKEFSDHKYQIFSSYYNSDKVKLFPFSPELVKKISLLANLFIISTAPKDVIIELLTRNQLLPYFKKIRGNDPRGKRDSLQDMTNQSDDVYFVSDTVGDILEAENLPITTIAVTWGFHSVENLATANPTYIVDSYQELLKNIG